MMAILNRLSPDIVAAEVLYHVMDKLMFIPNPAIAEWHIDGRDLLLSLDEFSARFIDKMILDPHSGNLPLTFCNRGSAHRDGVEVDVDCEYRFNHDIFRVRAWIKHDGPKAGAAFPEAVLLRGLAA